MIIESDANTIQSEAFEEGRVRIFEKVFQELVMIK